VRTSEDARLIVGLVGLGNMGTAMAERVLDAGYRLGVYNRTPGKADALAAGGAFVAETPADLVGKVDAVLTSLPNDEAFEEVAEEIVTARTARHGADRHEHRLGRCVGADRLAR
jgi:3-hydroxyisobutyrate dehydrogenase-like beta-hydroxyacid dehydrogenase